MPTPLIHIGYPKALSTWLQTQLFVPENGFATVLGPLGASLTFRSPPPFTFRRERAKKRLYRLGQRVDPQQSLVPVISSEHLSGNMHRGGYDAETIAHRLHDTLPDARILIIIREQRRRLRSLYSSLVRSAGDVRKPARVLAETSVPGRSENEIPCSLDYLRYHFLVGYYQYLFGKRQVLVLPQEMFEQHPQRFLRRLCQFSGTPCPPDITETSATKIFNPSSSLFSLWLMRCLNRRVFYTGFSDNGLGITVNPVRRAMLATRFDAVFRKCVPMALEKRMEQRFSDRVERLTEGRFEKSNDELQQLTGLNLAKYGYQTPETCARSGSTSESNGSPRG